MSDITTLSYVTLDVFTTTAFTGNPLAVIHLPSNHSNLPQETKQQIAREFNYSETVFLHLPATTSTDGVPEYKVNIFVTDKEIPLAGHPVIGTATHIFTSLLATSEAAPVTKARLLTKAGPVELTFNPADRTTAAALPHDIHTHNVVPVDHAALAKQQPGLARVLDINDLPIETVSIVNGMAFVYVKLPDLHALGQVQTFAPKLDSQTLDEGWRGGVLGMMFYVDVSDEGGDRTVKLRTRMISGTLEDPATGSASSGLAALLSINDGLDKAGTRKYRLTQAVEFGRKSEIGVDVVVADGKIQDVVLQGTAVEVMSGRLRYA